MKSVFLAAVLWMAAGVPVHAGTGELLANGDFETGCDGWEGVGCTFALTSEVGLVRAGDAAAVLSDDSGDGWVYQTVPVQPGGAYAFCGWAMKNDSDVGCVYLRIRWFESTDGFGMELYNEVSPQVTDDSEEYQYVRMEAVAPLNGRSARVECVVELVGMPAEAGVVYFDDVSFTGPAPSTPTAEATPAASPSPAATPTLTPTPTPQSVPGPSPTPATTATATPTATPSLQPTPTPTPGGTSAGTGDVVINEVTYDPLQHGSEEHSFEWLELYNATDEAIDIRGWTLADNWDTDAIPAVTLPPAGFVVIAAGECFYSDYPGFDGLAVVLDDARIGNGLGNDGDHLTLKDGVGSIVSEVSYGSDGSRVPHCAGVKEGHSLERVPPGGEFCDNPDPTPGRGVLDLATPAASPTPAPLATPTSIPASTSTPAPGAGGPTTTPVSTPAPASTPEPSDGGPASSGIAVRAAVVSAAIACLGVGLWIRSRRRR